MLVYQLMKKHSSYFSAHLCEFLTCDFPHLVCHSVCSPLNHGGETTEWPHQFANYSNGAALPFGLFSSLLKWGQKTRCLYIQYFSTEWFWKNNAFFLGQFHKSMLSIINLKLFITQPQQNIAYSKMRFCKIIYFSGQLFNKVPEVFSLEVRRQPKLWKHSVPELNLFESLMQSDRLQWKLTLDTHGKHYPLQEHRACATQNSWRLQSNEN